MVLVVQFITVLGQESIVASMSKGSDVNVPNEGYSSKLASISCPGYVP